MPITTTPKALSIVAACALLVGSTIVADASPYVVTIDQDGTNVVATGSGNIDLTGLTASGTDFFAAGINSSLGIVDLNELVAGPAADVFTGPISGPSNFGSGCANFCLANTFSGNFVGFDFGIRLFPGYVSDAPLGTSIDTFDNTTLALLGATPGIYKWTWGTGADQSFQIDVGATAPPTPLPAGLPLFATGLGALGLLGWFGKRKARVSVLGAA